MGDWVALGSRTNFLVGRLEGESARKTTNQIASGRKCLILLSAIRRTKDKRGVQLNGTPLLGCDDGTSGKGKLRTGDFDLLRQEGRNLLLDRHKTWVVGVALLARGCTLSVQPLSIRKSDTRFRQQGRTLWRIHTFGNHGTLHSETGHVAPSAFSLRKRTRNDAHRLAWKGHDARVKERGGRVPSLSFERKRSLTTAHTHKVRMNGVIP